MRQETFEDRDFIRVVEELEEKQRHDLSVHLYLSFLLHQVNPYFPHGRWSSWPVPIERVVDPQEQSTYEDIVVDNLFRDFEDGTQWGQPSANPKPEIFDEDNEELKFAFARSDGAISVSHKRVRKSNPKATVVNEMYAALQRVIFKKACKLAKQGQRVSVKDSQLTKAMALQLANKLDLVFTLMNNHGRRRAFFSRTWQDVLIASLRTNGYGEVCDLKSHKKAYLKARKLFLDTNYKYEYDPELYSDGKDKGRVPDFDVDHHMTTIEDEARVQYPKSRPPIKHLETLKTETAMKDHIFWTLYKLKMTARQLSWKESDILSDYVPPEDDYQEERESVFKNKQTALIQAQFEVDDGYA